MSSRAVKKLQKREQQQALKGGEVQENQEQEEEEEQEVVVQKPQKNYFMMGMDSDSDEKEENDDDEDKENQEEEKEDQKQQQQQQQNQKKNKKKKNKNKGKGKQQDGKEEEEDLDKILEELNMKPNNDNQNQSQQEEEKGHEQEEFKNSEFEFQQGNMTLYSPLQMVTAKLNYEKELQKYFKNAKFIEQQQDEGDFEGIKDKRVIKRLKNLQKPKSSKQFKLVPGLKYQKPVPERFMCEVVSTNKYGQDIYAFFPTKQYEKLQGTYEGLKNTFDPQNIFDFVQNNPYHVDALFDICEFFRLQGNFKQANQLLSNIFYVYEDSFGLQFKQIFEDIDNKFCLSFDHNGYAKTLFMALLRFSDTLGKKGCFRAAFEYNKFLLKLNPYNDPVGALLSFDYNALSSKQFGFLQYFIDNFAKNLYKNSSFSIIYMPNMIYSYSLAKFQDQKDALLIDVADQLAFQKSDFETAINFSSKEHNFRAEQSSNVLILVALLLYPRLLKNLAEKNEFHKQNVSHSCLKGWQQKSFKQMMEHKFFQESEDNTPFYGFLGLENDDDVAGFNKIVEVYIERSKIVYKNNQIVLWLKAAVGFLLNEIDEREFQYDEFVAGLCEKQEINLIPFSFSRYKQMQKSYFSDQVDQIDLNNIEQEELQQMQQQQHQGQQQPLNPLDVENTGALRQFFTSFLPWVNLPQNNNNNVVYQDEDVQIMEEDQQNAWQSDDEDDQ